MAQNTSAIQGFGAYRDKVNIELFNDIISFVMATPAESITATVNSLNHRHLWYSRSDNDNIQERYGLRYLGELLERYEDKAVEDFIAQVDAKVKQDFRNLASAPA